MYGRPVALPSFADPPFAYPPDVTIDLPSPLSVNRVRRVDRAAMRLHERWLVAADALVLSQRLRNIARQIHCFELHIVFAEKKIDLDNGIKQIVDYLRRIELIENDAPANLRKLTVEWGDAPEGVRVTVRPLA
jgi:hypothetical protein